MTKVARGKRGRLARGSYPATKAVKQHRETLMRLFDLSSGGDAVVLALAIASEIATRAAEGKKIYVLGESPKDSQEILLAGLNIKPKTTPPGPA